MPLTPRPQLLKQLAHLTFLAPLVTASALAQSPPPVSAYAGKYPYDAVQDVPFFQHPAVRAALRAAVSDPDILRFVMDPDNVVTPLRETRGRFLTSGYQAASGGDVNWAILLVADGSKAAVCYSTGIEPDRRGADWYIDGQRAFTLSMHCPSRPADIEAELGDWPVGGIPG